ncbi:MAG: UbiA family prenyltransferase [Deltaproteobacteria bacterium]|nr:UbiA family prenyltransferase [Deltaproteobacteria bacterium]
MVKVSSRQKIRGLLQLVRLPNIFTAMADILAGALIVSGLSLNLVALLWLLLASSAIYGAGCVLNDIRDRREDARTRPERPIPSGAVSPNQALVFCLLLFAVGLAAAAWAGRTSFLLAAILTILVFTYDCLVKNIKILGPLAMAGCRSVNLLLGMSVNPSWTVFLVFPVLTLGYVYFLTWLGTFETGRKQGGERWLILSGFHLVLAGFLLLTVQGALKPGGLIFILAVCLMAGPPLWKSALHPGPEAAGRCVKYLVLAIPVLDAAYVAGAQHYLLALPVICFLIPAMLFAKIFNVS